MAFKEKHTIAIFEIKDKKVNRIKPTEFKLKKDLEDIGFRLVNLDYN
jgi:PP-loop superfamily ATP-utilizing enzyme